MLNPGESVVQGLRRWGAKLQGDRRRRRSAKGTEAEGESSASAADKAEARKAVEELTSVADALMESGETDVYFKTKVGRQDEATCPEDKAQLRGCRSAWPSSFV